MCYCSYFSILISVLRLQRYYLQKYRSSLFMRFVWGFLKANIQIKLDYNITLFQLRDFRANLWTVLMDPQRVWLQTTSLLGDRLTYLVISSGKQIPRLLFFTRWLKAATMEDTPMADLTNLLVQMESIGRTGVWHQWVGSSVIKTQGTGEWIWSLILLNLP